MTGYFFTFRTITPAQRGEMTLVRAGVRCNLRRTPSRIAQRGCGYCLWVPAASLQQAVDALWRDGISYSKVYYQNGERLEEIQV